jgi:alpha-N-arabinofuranosidase
MTPEATIAITADAPAPIDPRIYGHFLEQAFFRNIEGGVFDEDSPQAVAGHGALDGCRADVIDACRSVGMPVVRWPGGNFTSAAWWQDGTGPRDQRPRRLELAWGNEESNRFGTPEFLAWCEATGAAPYLAHSARGVDDAVRWVEYCNYAGDTAMTRRRAADGLPDPRPVKIWGLGNEVYGPWQMGHRPADRYAADALEHARFMRAVDPDLRFVAVGDHDPAWTDEVVRVLGEITEWISVHSYGADFHLVDPSVAEWEAVVSQSVHFEQALQVFSELLAVAKERHGITSPLAIALDEWNMRHYEPRSWPEPEAGADGGIAPRATSGPFDLPGTSAEVSWRVSRYSPRTLADMLFYAGVLQAVHRTAGNEVPVTMTNTVNLINAHGAFVVRGDHLVRSATFHVYDTYLNHFGSVALPARVDGPARTMPVRHEARRGGEAQCESVPATIGLLDVSASCSADGRSRYLAVINRSPDRDVAARVLDDPGADVTSGADGAGASGGEPGAHVATTGGVPLAGPVHVRTIGADATDLWAHNTVEHPDTLAPHEMEVTLVDGEYTFPAHSLTVLQWDR